MMAKVKLIKRIGLVSLILMAIGGGIIYYLFHMPHRNVQEAKVDYSLKASDIVQEYLSNQQEANQKYLDSEGDSKILQVTGLVSDISEDFNSNIVVLLRSPRDSAGVSCTFSPETNKHINSGQLGKVITVKGVIRSGASFDPDLSMYENVIMEKCDVQNN